MSSLLAHLAQRLTDRTEDIAVEALGYILSQSIAARCGLDQLLRAGGAEVPELAAIRTQAGEEGTRPDVVGFDDQDKERVFIEAKFWAGLTDNQPKGYLDRLPDGCGTALLFVAPEARLETLWPEICRRAECDPAIATGDPRSVAISGQKRLILTSWRALLNSLSAEVALQGDRAIDADICQLHALCQRQDEEAFLPLRADEFAPCFPRRLLQLNRLVDAATERAIQAGVANTQGLIRTPQTYGYGRYLRLGKSGAWAGAWFGVHQELWASCRETPIWLVFSSWEGTLPVAELRKRLGEDIWAGTENAIPIELPTLVERDTVLETVVERLSDIATAVATRRGAL